IVLGRGEDNAKVQQWLTTAAAVQGFIGFGVGRTDLWDPLVQWRANKVTRQGAALEMARRYREFVEIFEKAAAACTTSITSDITDSGMSAGRRRQLSSIGTTSCNSE